MDTHRYYCSRILARVSGRVVLVVVVIRELFSLVTSALCVRIRGQRLRRLFTTLERVSTRVVVVVVVAQPDCLPTLVRMSQAVTEPKSHSSLPKHLPLHTQKSLEKVHPATNFTIQSLAASLVK